MNICGEDLGNEFLCCQTPGHLDRGVPHLRMEEGALFWELYHALFYIANTSTEVEVKNCATKAIEANEKYFSQRRTNVN